MIYKNGIRTFRYYLISIGELLEMLLNLRVRCDQRNKRQKTVSNAVSSASIVDLVEMVYLQDFHETAPPSSVNTYSLVAFISSASASEMHFESLYPSSTLGSQCSEFHSYPSSTLGYPCSEFHSPL